MMADGGDNSAPSARTIAAISNIPANVWDRLANMAGAPTNPFVSHAFLKALESSMSATPDAGWTPSHIVLEEAGVIVGAAPVYIKAHSFGEYVFDHHWADALERAGGRYYPKLLCAVPFTPVPGPRLLAGAAERKKALSGALIDLSERVGASSAHVNFVGDDDAGTLAASGYLSRRGIQYHWFNRGYRAYDDFLETLSSRKRKMLRRERKEAGKGLTIRRIEGPDLNRGHWDSFWTFYQDTGGRKWGRPYLTRAFFEEIAETMASQIMMVIAEEENRPVAGALNFIGGDAIYGRYWGRIVDRPFLHFEVCYHQAIEFAIERGLARVEAGAQGDHKISRGYEPVPTLSAHHISNKAFRDAIERYLSAETASVEAELAAIARIAPFKRNT